MKEEWKPRVLEFLTLWIGMIYYFAAGAVLNVRDAPGVALACVAFPVPLLAPPVAIVAVVWRLARRRVASAGRGQRAV